MNDAISRLSRMSVGNGTFRSEMKEILQNKYVLYAILIIAVLNVIGYLALKNTDAVLFFILTFLLTIYFSRNMIVVLFISIIATNFYVGTRGVMSSQEGLKNKDEHEKEGMENDDKKDESADAAAHDSGDSKKPKGKGKGAGKGGDKGDGNGDDEPTVENVENLNEHSADAEASTESTAASKGTVEKKNKPRAGMQNLKPAKFKPSKPSGETDKEADDESDDDDDGHAKVSGSKGNRVDYAQTLGQAYDNLQNIIGKDGVKGLTNQTKDLMEQQKVLMNNMKDMEPLIKSAQGFMNQIMGSGGLDGISKLFDGKLFGAIAPAVAENGKSLESKK